MKARMVTVFGASGFLGRHVVRALARDGWRVRAAVRNPATAQFLRPLGDVGQVTPLQANIRESRSTRAAIEGADAVVNLVGILYETRKQKFEAVHARGAERIARACAEFGVRRLIHVSAIGADPNAQADYLRTKGLGEEAAQAHVAEAVVLRPSIVFGPEDDFFNRFAAMARLSPILPLIGGGHTRFQPVYVGDVATAVAVALRTPDAEGAIYELGGPRVYSFEDLLRLTLKETGRRRLLAPIPFWGARIKAKFLQYLPNPPLTPDQVKMLEQDNVVRAGARTLADLGIAATAVEAVIPTYLWRFRARGQYETVGA